VKDVVDVIIIGGGLAGVSAARTLIKGSDVSVALVEERGIGSNNPSPMTFADVLDQFGLTEHSIARYQHFLFHSPLGAQSRHSFDGHPLVLLDYQKACQTLLQQAQQSEHLSLVQGRARTLRRDEHGRWVLEVLPAGESKDTRRIYAPLLIDASGASLFATRQLGLPEARLFSHCYGEVRATSHMLDDESALLLAPCERFGNGGGWFYPLGKHRASFGYATLSSDANYPGSLVRERFRHAFQEFEPYASWLADMPVDHIEQGIIPLYPPRRLAHDGLLLIGDAARSATIWTCMGVEQALVTGHLAGEAAIQACRQGVFARRVLVAYEREWNRLYRRMYQQSAWLAPIVWRQGEASWNQQTALLQRLTPEQMLARLRVNWPQLSWPQIAFTRCYDLAGRMRRRLAASLSRKVSREGMQR